MRFAVFVFSILLIFSTTYAHALIWLPAVKGAVIRTAAGKVIKVASKTAFMSGATIAVVNYCKKNKKKCDDILGETASDYFFGDDDDEDARCSVKLIYQSQGKYFDNLADAKAYYGTKRKEVIVYQESTNIDEADVRLKDNIKRYKRETKSSIKYLENKSDFYKYYYEGGNPNYVSSGRYDISFYAKIICSDEEKQQELAKKIAEHLSDDDIDQIINNYSKEIEINIDKYCATAGACAELEQSFGDEVMNNKNKYDIDKINKDNCEVNNGKITSCEKAKIKKDTDDDDSTQPKDPKKPDDGDDGQDGQDGDNDTKAKDDKPIDCDATEFHKKVCDFIDWYQSDDYEKTDNKINIQDDTPQPTNTNIEFSGSCPASYVFSYRLDFGFLGSHDFEFTLLDTPKLCTFLNDWIKPIMMFLGPLHAVYIIGKRDE